MPPLHQRHKSTGNIAALAATSATGFRGPAKRSAFGDVTNQAKNVGVGIGRDEIKVLKPQASSLGLSRPQTAVNKENAPYNQDALSRPAQRPAVLAKPKIAPTVEVAAPKTERGVAFDPSLLPSEPEIPIASLLAYHETHASLARQQSLEPSQPQPPQQQLPLPPSQRQPRHHKSQPQLKQQQGPVLRKTQSRLLEKFTVSDEKFIALDGDRFDPSMASREHDHAEAHITSLESLYLPAERDEFIQPEHSAEYVPLASKLPDISEEASLVPVSYKDAHTPALSEPEECWDEEDDEDYEDQDQAYMTAHSFKSRDMTTGGVTTVIAPRVTAKVQRELEEARLEVERTRPQDDIEEEMWDVSLVAEYSEEIFEYMRELEVSHALYVLIASR